MLFGFKLYQKRKHFLPNLCWAELSEDLESQIIRDERKFKQELDEQTSVNLYLENQLKQTQTDLKDLEAKNTLRIEELTIEYERKIERQRKRAQAQDREDKRLRDTFMKSLYKDQQVLLHISF